MYVREPRGHRHKWSVGQHLTPHLDPYAVADRPLWPFARLEMPMSGLWTGTAGEKMPLRNGLAVPIWA